MSNGQRIEQAVKDTVLEAYRLGRDFESECHVQPDCESYDGLCEYVARETEKLCRELAALLQVGTLSSEVLLVERESRTLAL